MNSSVPVAAPGVTQLPPSTRPTEPLVIEESDLVKLDGDFLYVHNARTGLHVIDVTDPQEPTPVGRVPEVYGASGEIYVTPEHALLLVEQSALCARSPGTAVVSVTSPTTAPAIAATTCLLEEDLVSSRLIGGILYVVTAGSDASGDWTRVRSLDVTQGGVIAPVESESWVGAGLELHVTQQAIYVTQRSDLGGTRVHYLDIAEGDGSIVGRDSIDVIGAPMGRFHMSEYDQTFRIVTHAGVGLGQQTYLTVIDVADPDHLLQVGELSGIAPGEALFATRFVGDFAYIVTYEPEVIVNQTVVTTGSDPLWIVSLKDPSRPVVMGELEIPGWSDYIFPRGDRLLAVGRGDNGRGVAASLFDVGNPYMPVALRRVEFGNDTATSEANSDFRGVTVVEEALGAPPLVVVPYTDNIGFEPNCTPEHHVQLIDLLADDLELRGNGRYAGNVRRTLPVGDALYVVSERTISATDVSDRDLPQAAARITVDDTTYVDACDFPPQAPVVVQTQVVSVGPMWADDTEESPTLCGCATATKPSSCFGKNMGWLAVVATTAFGVTWRRRRQRRRVRGEPSTS